MGFFRNYLPFRRRMQSYFLDRLTAGPRKGPAVSSRQNGERIQKRDGALADPVPCLWCHSPCGARRSAAAAAAVVVAVIAAPAAPAAAIAAQQEQDDDGDDDPPAAGRTLIAHIY